MPAILYMTDEAASLPRTVLQHHYFNKSWLSPWNPRSGLCFPPFAASPQLFVQKLDATQ